MTKVAVFDVGGTAIKHCLMVDGKIERPGEVPTPDRKSRDPEAFLAALDGVLAAYGGSGALDGVAFSLPGVIDVDTKVLRTGGALMYNYGADAHAWERRWDLPVEIENDAKCGAFAELTVGSMQGVKTGLVLIFGTGIGGCAIIDGKLHKGANLYAGEASMINRAYPDCSSGFYDASSVVPVCATTGLCLRVAAAKGVPSCNGREAFAWIEAGDPVAEQAFSDVCDDIALLIHNAQCWIDPERVALGGGISQNPLFTEGVRAAHRRLNQALCYDFPEAEIVTCAYHNDANLIGAYQHFIARQGLC